MMRMPAFAKRVVIVCGAFALIGLTVPGSVQAATTYEAGTFVMGGGGATHVHLYYGNVAWSGKAVKGTLAGWRLEIVAEEASDCLNTCQWNAMRWYLSHGDDAMWGGCYRFPDRTGCVQGGRSLLTGNVDMAMAVSGGAGHDAGITGAAHLGGILGLSPGLKTDGPGEVRLTLALN